MISLITCFFFFSFSFLNDFFVFILHTLVLCLCEGKSSDPLELELRTVVSHHVCGWDRTGPLEEQQAPLTVAPFLSPRAYCTG